MSPGVAILSAAITVMALVLSIFGAAWLNQRNTEKLVDQLEKRFDHRFASLETRIDGIERQMEIRFGQMETRFDRIERQLEALFKPILPPK